MYKIVFFRKTNVFLFQSRVFYRALGCGTRRGLACTRQCKWFQAGLHGACFGCSNSRSLASNHGVAFREARAEQGNGKPTFKLYFFFFSPLLYSHSATVRHSRQASPVVTASDTTYACVDTVYACVCCVCVSVRVCTGLCTCWHLEELPLVSFFLCWY